MKEMIKSKGLMVFIIMILGVVILDSSINVRLEETLESKNNEIVMANIK